MTSDTRVWHGAPELASLLVPITDLVLLPDNPRQGDIGAISLSLERLGQQKPIVVDDDLVVLAGNHLTQAATHLGWTHIAAVTTDLQGTDKTRYALADNRLSDLGDYDHDLLIAQLQSLDHLDGIGYDADDLDDLIAFSQEDFAPTYEGTSSNPTIQEREARRAEARAAGMEVRSLVFLLQSDEYETAVRVLDSRGKDTNTEAFLDLIAEHDG